MTRKIFIKNSSFQAGPFGASGLSKDALVLFLNELLITTKKQFILELEDGIGVFDLYARCFENGSDSFVYYPAIPEGGAVPGFVPEEKRYQKEATLSLLSKKPIVCIGAKGVFDLKTVQRDIKRESLSIDFKLNEKTTREKMESLLNKLEYKKEDIVKEAGSFSVRGDILDVYPYHFKNPARISFNYEEIEKISLFDPISQLNIQSLKRLVFKDYSDSQVTDKATLRSIFSSAVFLRGCVGRKGLSIFVEQLKDEKRCVFFSNICVPIDKKKDIVKNAKKASSVFFVGNKKPKSLPFKFSFIRGSIEKSFFIENEGVFVVSQNQYSSRDFLQDRWQPASISSYQLPHGGLLSEVKKGDLLVHRDFGIGQFCGTIEREEKVGFSEGIEIEYKNNSRVFVSSEQLFLVQKYVGGGRRPMLSNLGSKKWSSEVKKAKKAIESTAKEIVSIYSKKTEKRGFSFVKTDDLDKTLAGSFSFIETPDQKKAIRDVYSDMNGEKPMDRLVCGDVGYGKTEVAIRAVFKSFLSDKLSVLLCPTTILADQHFITCTDRLEKHGVRISLISRFKSKKEQKLIIDSLSEKKTDLLIGTHRILSDDIELKNLGLLIIDEEHRFGVKHKEKIRSMKERIDVLTMTATPIPRTLQQSLVGLKDLSTINTPPISRKPILTSVKYFNWDSVVEVVSAELFRGGQVYFLNNDTKAIPSFVEKISSFFPNKVVVGASGKMESKLLEKTVLGFFSGDIDVLVCTTIIESGLDVTNANTIIINNAHNFGLPQLYQIRGRVGRAEKQARCLLLIPNKPLEKEAYQRLKTIEQNTALGAGYNISMKDLEIRGAGSLFGYHQSGHISSVGFELYCDLLKEEINKNKTGGHTSKVEIKMLNMPSLDKKHISSQALRIDYYYRIAKTTTLEEVYKIEEEMKERFGDLPKKTITLLNISKLKAICSKTSISRIFISKRETSLCLKTTHPFDSLEDLFSSVSKFSHREFVEYRYENKPGQGLFVFLKTKNQIPHMNVLFSFVNLFNTITN